MRLAAKWRRRGLRPFGDELEDSRQLVLQGGGIEVLRLGAGEPIVLVPGLAGGWRLLAPLARRLATRHEVFLYGLRGDRTPIVASAPESLTDYVRDLAALIDALGLERPTVFGVSFGGAIALELAIASPRSVGALVLNGVEARFRMGLGATIAQRVLERFPLPSDNRFVNQFFNLLHGGRPQSPDLAEFVVERCWETDQGIMARRLRLLEEFDISDRLWQVEAPTLVLAGTRDVIVPASRQRALVEAIPGARFETLQGAGHIGFLSHKAEVARLVHQLVGDVHGSPC
jgi:3-oxoadipate enol-lactonase